ncbi:hypothetical protein JCM33374_g6468 [Metschnikowia sp. JCM 33374]|nr:hypothetical protein JCM33374_g6468 [Metschnikowia sp. JCM 33374]
MASEDIKSELDKLTMFDSFNEFVGDWNVGDWKYSSNGAPADSRRTPKSARPAQHQDSCFIRVRRIGLFRGRLSDSEQDSSEFGGDWLRPENMISATYDWRWPTLTLRRDAYFTKLELQIESTKAHGREEFPCGTFMGSQVILYFMKWVEAEGSFSGNGPSWCNDLAGFIDISGSLLGTPKAIRHCSQDEGYRPVDYLGYHAYPESANAEAGMQNEEDFAHRQEDH